MSPQVCAVTGAGGHVGVNLVPALLAAGHVVRAIDRVQARDEHAGLECIAADVRDRDALARAFSGVDVVYHLAARISVSGDPDGSLWSTNVEGVRSAAHAALMAGVRRFVHCSSVHAYDLERAGAWLDESGPRSEAPRLPVYDRSKWAGELALREVVTAGLRAVVVNPTGVIGPGDRGLSYMGRVLLDLYAGRLPAVVAGGFDWVDVRDLCAALMVAAERGRVGENYLTPGHHATVRELAVLAERNGGRRAPSLRLPMWVSRALVPLTRRVDVGLDVSFFTSEALHALANHPRVDGSKAWRELGHRPRPLTETVRDTYGWYAAAGLLPAPAAGRRVLRLRRRAADAVASA